MPLRLILFQNDSLTGILLEFGIFIKSMPSCQWLVSKCEWIYNGQSLKYVLESLDKLHIAP